MEFEVRFYFPIEEYNNWFNVLNDINDLTCAGRKYEITSQYNHPMKDFDFYSKEIDGRFRVRLTKSEINSKCKISWKRRLKDTAETNVNKEEEVELSIKENEYNNLIFLLENVIHLEKVESYERYRTVFENEEIEIVLDEYPFGLAMEIEAKTDDDKAEKIIDKYMNLLNLSYTNCYRLSWDDKYLELCQEQGFECYKFVEFNKPMPKVK